MNDLYCVVVVNDGEGGFVQKLCTLNKTLSGFVYFTEDINLCHSVVDRLSKQFPQAKYSIKKIILEDI